MNSSLDELLFEHFRQSYQFQLERIDKLRDRASFVVAMLSILGSVLGYVLAKYPHGWHDGWGLLFYIPIALASVLFTVSAAYLGWVVGWPFKYEFLPDNNELHSFANQIKQWTAECGRGQDALAEFKKDLTLRYRQCSHTNFRLNRLRTDGLIVGQRLIVAAFMLAFAAAPRFSIEKFNEDEKPTKVILISDCHLK